MRSDDLQGQDERYRLVDQASSISSRNVSISLLIVDIPTPFPGQFRRQCMHFGNNAGNFGGSAVRQRSGMIRQSQSRHWLHFTRNCMQIVQNWSEKGVVVWIPHMCLICTCLFALLEEHNLAVPNFPSRATDGVERHKSRITTTSRQSVSNDTFSKNISVSTVSGDVSRLLPPSPRTCCRAPAPNISLNDRSSTSLSHDVEQLRTRARLAATAEWLVGSCGPARGVWHGFSRDKASQPRTRHGGSRKQVAGTPPLRFRV